MPNTIYTFKNVEFKTKGDTAKSWPVAAATIILEENGIPHFIIRVDPAHTALEVAPPIVLNTLTQFAELNDEVQKLAMGLTKADFKFDVYTSDGTLDQHFEAIDWVVTNGGFVTTPEGFGFELTVVHPLGLCNMYSSSFGGLIRTTASLREAVVGGADIPKSIAQGLATLGDQNKTFYTNDFLEKYCSAPSGGADILEKFREDMRKASETILKYLQWDPTIYGGSQVATPAYAPWPVGYTNAVGQGTAETAMARYLALIFAGVKTSNVWDAIIQYVVNGWFTSVVPTWWKPHLTMVPSSPWLDPQVYILDTNIASVDFPSFERNRMSGAYCVFNHAVYQDSCNFNLTASKQMADGVLYRPANDLDGQLVDVSVPDWFMRLLQDLSGLTDHYDLERSGTVVGAQIDAEGSGANLAANDGAKQVEFFSAEHCVIERCVQQVFMSQFRAGSQIKVATRLMITSNTSASGGIGGASTYVCPGFVCRLFSYAGSAEDGTPVVDFYITQVVHQVRFDHGVANTTVAGKYVRPVEGLTTPSGAPIITQKENPVYLTPQTATT